MDLQSFSGDFGYLLFFGACAIRILPDSRGDPVRAAEAHYHPRRWSLQTPSSP